MDTHRPDNILSLNDEKLARVERELREAKEAAEESARVKSAFLATISHELRTPLHQIAGLSAIIQDESTEESVREYARFITRGVEEFLAMVDDLFVLAVAEHARLELRPEVFDVDDFVRHSCRTLEQILEVSGRRQELKIVCRVEAEVAGTVWRGDQLKIRRILDNFFKNAAKFSDPGEIVFGCRALAEGGLEFYVHDNGPGIPMDKRAIIFDLFRQADEAPTRNHGGMGIGLAICKKFADALGAELVCKPGTTRGTTFYIKVPLVRIG